MSTINELYRFASSSSKSTYETLVLDTGLITCNCPGWTRRTTADGQRTCKHVRSIQTGHARSECSAYLDYRSYIPQIQIVTQEKTPATPPRCTPLLTKPGVRRLAKAS
jgi:hypothetical protein